MAEDEHEYRELNEDGEANGEADQDNQDGEDDGESEDGEAPGGQYPIEDTSWHKRTIQEIYAAAVVHHGLDKKMKP